MNLKKILFILFAIFLTYITYNNILSIDKSALKISTLRAILFGSNFTFCVTGIFAFLGFVLPTYKWLPESYYKIRNSMFLKKIYAVLGVGYFSKTVVAFFYNKKKINAKYFNGNSEGINAFTIQTKQDEFGHIVPFVIICCYCFYLLFNTTYVLLLTIFLSNILLNLYPVIMQRHNRTYRLKD